MIKSMTGFGRGERRDDTYHTVCEVRSVNHRYLDVSVRLPRRYLFAEERVRELVKQAITRGKVEISYTIEATEADDTRIELNRPLAERYLAELTTLKHEYDLPGEVTLEYVASLPEVLRIQPDVEDEERILTIVQEATGQALAAHVTMREAEGSKLAEDMRARGEAILRRVTKIEERGAALQAEYAAKLRERMHDFLGDQVDISEERIATEAAFFADKANITEEIVRLRSHIAQLSEILSSEDAQGKKMDFLIQEMNREANTIGSKANDLAITTDMLEIKSEIEKIREQVQNIE